MNQPKVIRVAFEHVRNSMTGPVPDQFDDETAAARPNCLETHDWLFNTQITKFVYVGTVPSR